MLVVILQPGEIVSASHQGIGGLPGLIEKINELVTNKNNQDIQSRLNHIIGEATSILNADLVCLYKATGSEPHLVQYLSNDPQLASDLPSTLTREDLINLQEPRLWTPDRQAATRLHKAAAEANYQFIADAPLGNSTSKFGLLVACGKAKKTKRSHPTAHQAGCFIHHWTDGRPDLSPKHSQPGK